MNSKNNKKHHQLNLDLFIDPEFQKGCTSIDIDMIKFLCAKINSGSYDLDDIDDLAQMLLYEGFGHDLVKLGNFARKMNIKTSTLYTMLGINIYECGGYESACSYFEKAIKMDPENFLAHFYLGYVSSIDGEDRNMISNALCAGSHLINKENKLRYRDYIKNKINGIIF